MRSDLLAAVLGAALVFGGSVYVGARAVSRPVAMPAPPAYQPGSPPDPAFEVDLPRMGAVLGMTVSDLRRRYAAIAATCDQSSEEIWKVHRYMVDRRGRDPGAALAMIPRVCNQ